MMTGTLAGTEQKNLYVRECNSKLDGGYRKRWWIYDRMVGMITFCCEI